MWANFSYLGTLLIAAVPSTTLDGLFSLKPTTCFFLFFFFNDPHLVEYSLINTITANKLMDAGINVKNIYSLLMLRLLLYNITCHLEILLLHCLTLCLFL